MSHRMKKKAHSSEFKFKVAIEAIRGIKTSAELWALLQKKIQDMIECANVKV